MTLAAVRASQQGQGFFCEVPLRRLLPTFALLSALALPAAAHAITFTVTGSGAGYSGTGTLTAIANGGGSYTLTGLSAPGSNGIDGVGTFNGNDNLFFPTSATLVDNKGFAFSDTQGNTTFNVDVFSTGANAYSAYYLDNDGSSATFPVTMSLVAATPEPASWLLLATGLLAAAGLMRRRTVVRSVA